MNPLSALWEDLGSENGEDEQGNYGSNDKGTTSFGVSKCHVMLVKVK